MALLTFETAMRLLTQKKHQAVYDLAIEALRKNEKDPLAFFFLGIIASDHGQFEKALEFHAKASEHAPKNARYQAFHAKALMALGRTSEAKLRADTAAAFKTDDGFVADMIGSVYSRTGHHALALPLFRRAVRLNPKWSVFHFNHAACAQFTGDIKTAKSAYKKAVSLKPNFYRAWFSLASLETQTSDNNYLTKLESLFAKVGQDPDGRLLLGHAIAKTLEDLGRFPESLDWLEKAKAARKKRINYNRHNMTEMFAAATHAAQSRERSQAHDMTPIFIVGLPRTGTTLVDRIVSSHAKVASAGELDLFAQLVERETQISRLNAEPFFSSAQSTDLQKLGDIYAQQSAGLAEDATYLIDKTPMNFLYAGLIHRALPNARIIALRRNAMDACLSNYRQLFALEDRRFDYAFDLEDTAAYYRAFDDLMSHWRQTLPDNRFMEVGYEDIVHDQEVQTRRLLDFCGLDWDPACLNFHENAAAVDTASSVQVRQPLYSGSIGRWQKYGGKLDGLKATLGALADQ